MTRRDPRETPMTMVPEVEITRAIEAAKQELRLEFMANIDHLAMERTASMASSAKDASAKASVTSNVRYIKLILVLAAVVAAMAMQFAYAHENRARIDDALYRTDRMERAADHYRGAEWREIGAR